jgi:hypothetical protein
MKQGHDGMLEPAPGMLVPAATALRLPTYELLSTMQNSPCWKAHGVTVQCMIGGSLMHKLQPCAGHRAAIHQLEACGVAKTPGTTAERP